MSSSNKLFESKAQETVLGMPKEQFDKYFKISLWFLLTVWIAFTPIIMRLSFSVGKGVIQKDKYVVSSVHTLSFFMSIIIGQLLSYIFYGMDGWKQCFNFKVITILIPVSVGYAASEVLALVALSYVSPMWYAVIHKGRLLLTCAMTVVFLRRRISLLQWIQCFVVTSFVLAYCFVKIAAGKKTAQQQGTILGMVLLVINITVSVACSIYADWAYKKVKVPLTVQVAAGRISASLASAIITMSFLTWRGWWKYGVFGGPGGGWDFRVAGLLIWNTLRDWLTCANLLYLNAIWKALAAVVAIIITFITDTTMNKAKFEPEQCIIIVGIFFSVMSFSLTKKNELEYQATLAKNTEMSNKLAIFETASTSQA